VKFCGTGLVQGHTTFGAKPKQTKYYSCNQPKILSKPIDASTTTAAVTTTISTSAIAPEKPVILPVTQISVPRREPMHREMIIIKSQILIFAIAFHVSKEDLRNTTPVQTNMIFN
jgi:hypothetical protein